MALRDERHDDPPSRNPMALRKPWPPTRPPGPPPARRGPTPACDRAPQSGRRGVSPDKGGCEARATSASTPRPAASPPCLGTPTTALAAIQLLGRMVLPPTRRRRRVRPAADAGTAARRVTATNPRSSEPSHRNQANPPTAQAARVNMRHVGTLTCSPQGGASVPASSRLPHPPSGPSIRSPTRTASRLPPLTITEP
jgi:hypothetical protein